MNKVDIAQNFNIADSLKCEELEEKIRALEHECSQKDDETNDLLMKLQ